jgi:sugar phosphate isomerase/epimerase
MRVGIDGRKIPLLEQYGPAGSLDHAQRVGLEGIFFRTVLEMSPTLDPGELRAIRDRADALGLYLESGIGKVNPFAAPEQPEQRAAGDGDVLLGFRRMLEACRAMDVTEVWCGTANFKPQYQGYWRYDRFRTDVAWDEQLAATTRLSKKLAPIARDLGIHMNVETHEEITTFEIVRMVEEVGPDAVGITFDIANVTHRAEDPVMAARRVAPYVRQTHMKDVVHRFVDDGIMRQVRPVGHGLINFETILPLLYQHNPGLHLTIEDPSSHGLMTMQIYDPVWRASHPDLTPHEFAVWVRHAYRCEQKMATCDWPTFEGYDALPFDDARQCWFIHESALFMRETCERHGLSPTVSPTLTPAASA